MEALKYEGGMWKCAAAESPKITCDLINAICININYRIWTRTVLYWTVSVQRSSSHAVPLGAVPTMPLQLWSVAGG